MSPRKQLIILGALLVVLGIVAYIHFGRPRSPARNEDASPPPARSAPATTGAPAGALAEAKPADSAQNPAPSAADLRELADWFDVLRAPGSVIARRDDPVFGMGAAPAPLITAQPSPESTQTPSTQTPPLVEPGRLDGIIKVGNGPGKALFQGELYQAGDRIRGTTFTIVTVDDDSVTLKSGDRVIRRFWHD